MGLKEFFWPTKIHILFFVILIIIGLFANLLNFGAGQYTYSFPLYFYLINLPIAGGFSFAIDFVALWWILLPIYWYLVASIIAFIINRSMRRKKVNVQTEKTPSNF